MIVAWDGASLYIPQGRIHGHLLSRHFLQRETRVLLHLRLWTASRWLQGESRSGRAAIRVEQTACLAIWR
jgi:hypothetical protein